MKRFQETGLEGSLALPDGRLLYYTEYGVPDGKPVFFFHGTPGSHKEGAIWHQAAVSQSIRLIAPDRPGIGRSDSQPGRHFLDWPIDIAVLAKRLDLCKQDVSILATSGGSAYALACVYHQSAELNKSELPSIRNVVIVSGMYPLSLGADGMKLSTRIALYIVSYFWFILVPLLDWVMAKPARENPTLFRERFMKEAQGRPMVDRKCLQDDAEFSAKFVESVRHSFVNGARGPTYEAGLMGRAWGFDLQDVAADGIVIYQGGFDDACPVPLAVKAHSRLLGSKLRVYEYEGHLTLSARRQKEIVSEL